MPPTDENMTVDESFYSPADDKLNQTCPPEFEGSAQFAKKKRVLTESFEANATLDHERIYTSLTERANRNSRKELDISVADAFVHDPNSLTDEEREALMRRKRKDDAYKTALCESFRRTSFCSYGDECRFAHGLDELRLPVQPRGRSHPKYKTVLCDKFSVSGYCKYGPRCQFIHKITNPMLLKQRENMWKTYQSSNRTAALRENQENSADAMSPFLERPPAFDLNQSMPLMDSRWRPDRSTDRNNDRFSRPVDFRAPWPSTRF